MAPVAVVAAPVVQEKNIAANKIYIKPMLSSLEGIGSFSPFAQLSGM